MKHQQRTTNRVARHRAPARFKTTRRHAMRTHRHDKIQEALELLNEAAKEKSEELQELVGEKYDDIKQVLLDKAGNGRAFLSQTQKKLAKTLREEEEKVLSKAKEIDKKAHRNPWPFIGATA